MTNLQKLMHRFVPSHFENPFGLFIRLLHTRNPAAYFAILSSFSAIFMIPLDLVLEFFENRLYKSEEISKLPLIFICGPPRSGTSLVAQVLIKKLPVHYFNNVASFFPRSPIVSSKLYNQFCRTKKDKIDYKTFYGKTTHLYGPNDALFIWDRWLGSDRNAIPRSLGYEKIREMQSFFGAVEKISSLPVVAKNNSLDIYASIISEALHNAHFICLKRHPVFLAQSHFIARQVIYGKLNVSYGIDEPEYERIENRPENVIEDIFRQIRFHNTKIEEQKKKIGEEKFWIVNYEDFCQSPKELVTRVATQILNHDIDRKNISNELQSFPTANKIKIDPKIFEEIKSYYRSDPFL